MKKALLILMLLMAINFTAPPANAVTLRNRHLIEFAQGVNHRSVSDYDVLRKKTVMYLRYAVLLNRMLIAGRSNGYFYNSS
jgi:hypothetical protein